MSQAARALVVLALASGTAFAEAKRPASTPARPWTGYIRTPGAARTNTGPLAAVSSRIVYVKRCTSACTVHFDPVDDSRTGASSIAAEGSPRSLSAFGQPDVVWDAMYACVKETFAPFDIQVTDVNPGSTTPHFLNIVGGKPAELHPEYTGAGGVAPFDCGEIPNAITYTFDVYGPNADQLCWTAAQEIAHAFGLEHEFLQKDPLTYLNGDLPKRFRDIDAPCGEYEQFPRCGCKSTPQNTYRHIVGMFGPGAPTPPALAIKNPVDGKPTQPGFTVVADALDDVRVERVDVSIDGTVIGSAMKPFGESIFEVVTPDVGAGAHQLEVNAVDVQGVVATASLSFTQGPPCTASTVCKGTDVCVRGVCVAGPDAAGGLGAVCQSDNECISHRCVSAGEPLKHCVDECDLGDDSTCPDDFSCISAGAEGVCWPAPGGGCCDAGDGPQGPLLLALGLGVLVLRRRHARA